MEGKVLVEEVSLVKRDGGRRGRGGGGRGGRRGRDTRENNEYGKLNRICCTQMYTHVYTLYMYILYVIRIYVIESIIYS